MEKIMEQYGMAVTTGAIGIAIISILRTVLVELCV